MPCWKGFSRGSLGGLRAALHIHKGVVMDIRSKRVAVVLTGEEYDRFQEARFVGRYRSVGEMVRQAVKELVDRQEGAGNGQVQSGSS